MAESPITPEAPYFRRCPHCNQVVQMRQAPDGRWLTFDAPDRTHSCFQVSAFQDADISADQPRSTARTAPARWGEAHAGSPRQRGAILGLFLLIFFLIFLLIFLGLVLADSFFSDSAYPELYLTSSAIRASR